MEKSDRPVDTSIFGLKDGESEIVDADLLVNLLETYRFGKGNVPIGEFRSKAAAATAPPEDITEIEDEEDNDGSQGNKSVCESTSLLYSNSDRIILETTLSETGANYETSSNGEASSNEEAGYNWLESNSTNLTNEEKERQQNGVTEEEEEEVEEEEEKSSSSEIEEKSNLEKLLATQETYEFYCPSCSSCITRKVILKKKKRGKHVDLSADLKPNVPDLSADLKPNVPDLSADLKPNVPVDEPDAQSDIKEMEPPVKIHVLPETHIEDDDQEDEEEGDIFTCLACLKYFIRLGARFLRLDYITGKPVEDLDVGSYEAMSELDETPIHNLEIEAMVPPSYAATEIDQLDPMAENVSMNSTQQKQSKPPDVHSENKPEVNLEAMNSLNITQSPPQVQPYRERFTVELLKSTVYGGLTETITSLGVVSSASASGSSTVNILALAVANLAGGLIVLAQNLQDLSNNSDQDKDRYNELLGRRANFRIHILVAVLSYIFFGLIPPLVYAFSFYETEIKNYKLISVFSVSLICVILLGMIKVYVRKPPNSCGSPKSYLKSAAYYTSIVVASSGISYVVGDIMGDYIGKLGWFSSDQVITSPFDGFRPEEYRFMSF